MEQFEIEAQWQAILDSNPVLREQGFAAKVTRWKALRDAADKAGLNNEEKMQFIAFHMGNAPCKSLPSQPSTSIGRRHYRSIQKAIADGCFVVIPPSGEILGTPIGSRFLSLETMQASVKGYIETAPLRPYWERFGFTMYVSETGKNDGLPFNLLATTISGTHIFGNALLVDVNRLEA